MSVNSRCGRDPAARQALPQAGPGQLGRAVHRRVHVAARAAAEPARAARHRHLRRGRQRRGELYFYTNIIGRKKKRFLVCLFVMHKLKNYWANFKNSFAYQKLHYQQLTWGIFYFQKS